MEGCYLAPDPAPRRPALLQCAAMPPLETVFDSAPAFLLACGVLTLAQVVYVLLGFGAGLVAVGLLAFVLPGLEDAVVLLALVNLPAEVAVVAGARKEVSWRGLPLILLGVAVGVPAGAWMLARLEAGLLLAALGALLVVLGSAFLLSPPKRAVAAPPWVGVPVGLASGLLTGLFGTGGPPLVLWFQLRGLPKAAFRGSLMTLFLVMTLVRLPSYVAAGLITAPRLLSALCVLPAVLLGAVLGHRIHLAIEELAFRRLVSAALVAIGLLLLLGLR